MLNNILLAKESYCTDFYSNSELFQQTAVLSQQIVVKTQRH